MEAGTVDAALRAVVDRLAAIEMLLRDGPVRARRDLLLGVNDRLADIERELIIARAPALMLPPVLLLSALLGTPQRSCLDDLD